MAEITKTTTPKTSLPKEVFAVDVKNHELLKLAYDTYLANSRNAHPKTKDRGEVRGGGKKPWRQKGTGRARFGSSRNPIWRGGGVAFGPQGNENHRMRLTVTSKRVAVKQALTLANKIDDKIITIDSFVCPQGKTKEAIAILDKYKIDKKARVLLVIDEKEATLIQATNNLQQIKIVKPTYLNVFDILNADKILISKKSLPVISEWLVKKEEK